MLLPLCHDDPACSILGRDRAEAVIMDRGAGLEGGVREGKQQLFVLCGVNTLFEQHL